MRILLVSTTALKTPPESYGGLEWVVYLLAEGLVKLGHEPAIVVARGSHAPKGCGLIETVEVGKPEEEAFKVYKDKLKEFDIIHDHSWQKWSYRAKMEDDSLKVISTTHSPCPYRSPPPVRFPNWCGVSKAHATYMSSKLGIPVKYVYNGLRIEDFPFTEEKSDRYLSLNRIMPEKGVHEFVELMRRTRCKGDVVGEDVRLVRNQAYVQRVRDRCDGALVHYWGAVSNERKLEFLKNAKAVVCLPLEPYREVFGLMALESLACGTPVIALRNGGLAEIVENGKSGFVCDSIEDVEKVIKKDKVLNIKAEDCRKRAEEFGYMRTCEKYLSLYKGILDNGDEW